MPKSKRIFILRVEPDGGGVRVFGNDREVVKPGQFFCDVPYEQLHVAAHDNGQIEVETDG